MSTGFFVLGRVQSMVQFSDDYRCPDKNSFKRKGIAVQRQTHVWNTKDDY